MKKRLLQLLIFIIFTITSGSLVIFGTVIYFMNTLPQIDSLNDYNPALPSQILSKDGEILLEVGLEKREIVQIKDVPVKIIDAFLSAEDDKFFEHQGVDYFGLFRAMLANLKAGKVVQGGSTITQQVAKSLLLSRERSISRKIKDFLLAQKIEKKFTKDEILFLYLNQVYLGGGYYGVKTAFKGYFDKELSEATHAEAALVAGLLVAPSKYSPYVSPKMAKSRQTYVLRRMYETKKITKEEYQAALDEELKLIDRSVSVFKAGHFTDWVRQRVIEILGEETFLTGGYRVHTTLDYELQKGAEIDVNKGLIEIDKRQGYKGPIKKLMNEEEIEAFIIAYRKKTFTDSSFYFFLTKGGEIRREYSEIEEKYKSIEEERLKIQNSLKSKGLIAGNISQDPIEKVLQQEKLYEGVVLKTDDSKRIILVSVAGYIGSIPFDNFKWAHERSISEDTANYSVVTNPSTILKRGDVVLVKIIKFKSNLWDTFLDTFKKNNQDKQLRLEATNQNVVVLQLEQEPEVEGALVAMNPYNGEIISFVGGRDFSKSQFNRAVQSLRQPGSSFKPILYACALEDGYRPSDILLDTPESLAGVDESINWKPRNYDGKFEGPVSFREALEKSRNVPTIKLANEMGVNRILSFSERLGFDAKLPRDLSVSLGSFGVSLVNLVSTYSIFPNGGKIIYPKTITSIVDRNGTNIDIKNFDFNVEREKQKDFNEKEDSDDESIGSPAIDEAKELSYKEQKQKFFQEKLKGFQVYDERLAFLMTNLLRGVIQNGTGSSAKSVSSFIGGKTGTTNDYVDAWFIGFSSNLSVGVWTGFDDNKTLGWGETGAKSALPIWNDYMSKAIKKIGENDFRVPPGIINVLIDKDSGGIAKPSSRRTFVESFVEGMEPGSVVEQAEDKNENTQVLEDDDYYSNQ